MKLRIYNMINVPRLRNTLSYKIPFIPYHEVNSSANAIYFILTVPKLLQYE